MGTAYQVKHSASKHRINSEANSPLHAEKARQRVVLEDSFLQFAHVLRGGITKQHMLLPHRVVRLIMEVQLWPVVHDHPEIVVAMHVGDIMRRYPWRGTVLRIYNLQVARELPSPRRISIVELNERGLDCPVLRFLAESTVEHCCLLNIPDNAEHISKLPGDLILHFVLA